MNPSFDKSTDLYFLSGGGEMGELIRATDWSKTSLGNPGDWPRSLRTMVAVMLDNPFGMYIAWGKDYVQLYNDGYRPILGSTKHPQALGIGTRETFKEIWHIIESMFDGVMKGKAVGFPDFMLPLNRNGYVEECYFDFSYSPIRKEDGEVGGILVTVIETTNKKKAEENLKESEERFRTLADNIPNLAWMAEADGSIFWYNKKWYEYTGTLPDQMKGWGWQSVHDPEELPKVLLKWRGSIESGKPFEMVFPLKGADGSFRQFLTRVLPVHNNEGKIYQWFGTNTDITEQIEADQKLKESAKRFRFLIEEATIPTFLVVGPDMVIELANQAMLEVLGKGDSVIGKPYLEALPELKDQPFPTQLKDVYATGKTFMAKEARADMVVNGKMGTYYFNYTYKALHNERNEVFAIMCTAVNVTEQVLVRKKIEEAEEKARLAINSANLGIYEIVYATNEMITDKRFNEIWGFENEAKREQYIGAIHPNDLLLREKAHKESLISGRLDYTVRIVWIDKSVHHVRVTGKVLFNDKNTPIKLIGVIQDITDAVIAQQKVEKSESNLRQTILQAPVAMCILKGPDYVVELANDRMIELWGKDADTVMNKPIFEGVPEAREQGFEDIIKNVYTTGNSFSAQGVPINLPRGSKLETVYVNFVYEAYREADGSISGILAVAIDVTLQVIARQQIEEEVASRTMELAEANNNLHKSNDELAQFAYIASHDLQEPLRKISTFTQMLGNRIDDKIDDQSRNFLKKINKASSRMNTLIRDVLTYSELVKEREVFSEVDLNQVVESIITDYELLIEQKEATVNHENLPVIEAIPLQMSQLFSNLIGNSIKFSRKDIKPVLTISAYKLTEEEIRNLSLDPTIIFYNIQFTDNGIGFKEEYSDKVFNIFQKLHPKTEYEGTGIGLAMCKKIALNHHGDLNAFGSSENGAVFNAILPVKQIKGG